MTRVWFILAVLAIPFSDVYGLLPLGELQSELSAYIFLPLLGVIIIERLLASGSAQARDGLTNPIYLLPNLVLLMLGVIAFSGIMNLSDLLGPSLYGRYPIGKFMLSTMVMIYGFSLAYISYHVTQRGSWHQLVIKPISISIVMCAAVGFIEMLAPEGGLPAHLHAAISSAIHGGLSTATVSGGSDFWVEDGRLRSVCFEPPALAAFAGFAWPWAYAGVATASRTRKPAYIAVLLLCTALIVFAMSRTSAVLLFGNIIVYIMLRFVYLPEQPRSRTMLQMISVLLIALATAVLAFGYMNLEGFSESIRNSNYSSNITRYSLITSAINMFLTSPVWGYGFGQFGFHYINYLPSWGYDSFEIRAYVAGIKGWPPVYSIYARLAAECGILGAVVWTGIWLSLVRGIWRATVAYQRVTGKLLILSYPLIMSCICALSSGLAIDSVRPPMMWLSFGMSCCYIHDVRSRLAAIRRQMSTSGPFSLSPSFGLQELSPAGAAATGALSVPQGNLERR